MKPWMQAGTESEVWLASVLRGALILFLGSPFLFLICQFFPANPDYLYDGEFLWAFKNSFVQAIFSAFFSLVLGLWAAFGLIASSRHEAHSRFSCLNSRMRFLRSLLEILCLLPNFLPVLFILLATLNLLNPFPMGLVGIVIVHTLINFGLVAVLIAGLLEQKLGRLAEVAYLEGSSRIYFLRKIFLPLMQLDLLKVFLFVFIICFGSFAVPLIVGGGRGTTIEVLIYEKIRLSSEWGPAVILAFFQSVFMFGLSVFLLQAKQAEKNGLGLESDKVGRHANFLIGRTSGIFLIIAVTFFYGWGFGQGVYEGMSSLALFRERPIDLWQGLFGTLALAMLTGLLVLALLLLIAFLFPNRKFEKFLSGYLAPSTALTCFALLVTGSNHDLWPFIKIPLAMSILSLTTFYRMGWGSRLNALRGQIQSAQLLGAGRALIFREIMMPQLLGPAGTLAGLAAVWMSGDFAISRILAHSDLSWALMTETMMSAYRLNQASLMCVGILFCALVSFSFFYWGGRVLSRKSAN